ncbi:imidazole glycerol phosphate synthase [Flavobacterium akiainvivens]|uniref:Imidazole glycerol phosphate synthase subunit HisH n=1 Tax=Flavobacterium akiainvivens TaxID=1202724 RepID=A0A0M8MC65_9FLAO|nr:imidazole glycerol phosphate synthase subunit HisH [Flavobacterium akiainvivens]KOS05704.1 imidazole glycerol phosphate synthase [Flavobacterium akiainvivens]SFQ36974.1 imidazole glycerol phosphate synthase subunit hisH [Flavobacterium akiainvivens]
MTAIVKYNAGNTQSVESAVKRLGFECIVTADKDILLAANNVIFPGVGHAATAMAHLKATGLDTFLPQLTQPVLGICLGLQLMCRFTEEGSTPGLGIFDVDVKRFPPTDIVPHMGWNNTGHNSCGLFNSIAPNEHFYFVHSYYAGLCAEAAAQCNYILPYSAALQKDNFYAVQFHPEKSGAAGEQLLKNFLSL